MSAPPELRERIAAAPPGPGTIACFDYDGTLIAGYSASAFYSHRIRKFQLGPLELARTLLLLRGGIETEEDFRELLKLTLEAWKGRNEEEMRELGRRLFEGDSASKLRLEVWELIAAHRRRGHRVVLATSGTRFQVEPIAAEVGAEGVLCTELEVDEEGRITGRPSGRPLWGAAKADALEQYAFEHGADLRTAFAYSNGAEDVPMLKAVGNPTAVAPEPGLRRHAVRHRWPILECRDRGGRPGPIDLARTAAMYGGIATGMGVGIGVGLLRRSRRTAINLASGAGADLALALSGVEVKVVTGHEHLWSSRPCVFIINHQSGLDVPVVMKLVRGDFTGVVKKEARAIPVWGQLFELAGVAFIDRANTEKARAALEPAVRKLREEGISLAISPEGTRSPTPRVGPFKKGAFHIAMQAEVPIVPIVFRNTGELLWKGAQTLRPGTVEVVVLPPVSTLDWTPETLNEHVAAVHDMYVRTLEDWPRPRALPPADTATDGAVPEPVEVGG
jgi:putative phosphoserine phosphatase / 1-acylglycerol-3-phosphate O-acyltransferase